ncbi:MAG: DNA repair protein RadA [Bacteroidota bacterium]|nr:DNA repair protein RadA [Bacteroidota bacterium]|tara:strand:+ start:2124 stop:3479 length:1356 start_codon:yes stop_codon:yes gene_type:complete
MSKIKTTFYCKECGSQYSKWQGQCNKCQEWNSIEEEILNTSKRNKEGSYNSINNINSNPQKISSIEINDQYRIITKDNEFDRVIGGGIVPGSLVLLGGEPGIGKSTLFLQLSLMLSHKVLYVSGEESETQIKMRADRINYKNDNCYILTENKIENIFNQVKKINPQVLIIDSIQTLSSQLVDASSGSITQLRTCTAELISFAKSTSIPVLIIGHINKEGHIAGPKILEHMVDTVLQFEGDRNHFYRILRAKKNRFGSTNEIGIYEMLNEGLKEIKNPSEILISNSNQKLSGSAISAAIEGSRPFMIEVQALVSSAVYGTPQRSCTGFNSKRLNMLLAVLEKRVGFKLGMKDIFLNITGGIKVEDTAIDMAIVSAILSSNNEIKIPEDYCFAAEIGLSGEIRPVQRIEQRIKEAEKLGFSKIFISKHSDKLTSKKINIVSLSKIDELVDHIT